MAELRYIKINDCFEIVHNLLSQQDTLLETKFCIDHYLESRMAVLFEEGCPKSEEQGRDIFELVQEDQLKRLQSSKMAISD